MADQTNTSAAFCCGLPVPPGVGKYGCPNCNGDNVNKLRASKNKPDDRKINSSAPSIKSSETA